MAILETSRADYFGFQAANYLMDWCRRTNNIANIANYYVEDRIDGSTGLVYLYVRPIADLAADPSIDPSNPAVIDVSSPTDATVAAEDLSNG